MPPKKPKIAAKKSREVTESPVKVSQSNPVSYERVSPTPAKYSTPKAIYTKKARQALQSSSCRPSHSRSRSRSHSRSRSRSGSLLFEENDWDFPTAFDQERSNSMDSISETLAKLDKSPSSSPENIQSNRWTPRKEQLLCTLWENDPHLYNTKDDNYRNSRLRNKTLQRFAAHLKMSGSWNDRLTAKQKEIMKLCSFLQGHWKSKQTTSNLQKLKAKHPKAVAGCSKGTQDVEIVSETEQEVTEPKAPQPMKKVSKNEDEMTDISKTITSIASLLYDKPKDTNNTNELWGKLLSRKVDRMEEMSADRFKVKVDMMALDWLEGDK